MRSTASQQQIGDLINYWGRYFNVSPRLARAVFTQESSLDPNVKDGTLGEQGIAQLRPATAAGLGVTDPYDPNQSIMGGIRYLRQGLDAALALNHGNPAAYAVRFYNGGPNGPTRHATDPYIAGVAKNYAALPEDVAPAVPTAAPGTAIAAPPRADVGLTRLASAGTGDYVPQRATPSSATPITGPLPTNWADVSGAPPSMRQANLLPSTFKATSPAEQALWNQASTPQGYAALQQLAASGGGSAAPITPVARAPLLAPTGPAPSGPVATAAPAAPTWGGGVDYSRTPGLPGSPSGAGVQPPTPAPPVSSPMVNAGDGQVARAALPPPRTLSDETIAKMRPEDVFGIVTDPNLTDADHRALMGRLDDLDQQKGQ